MSNNLDPKIMKPVPATEESVQQVKDELQTKANASDVVDLTSSQTITGLKTFNANVTLSGTNVTRTSTLATDDNSNEVPTTDWIHNKFQVVSTLPANPDPNVLFYS